MSITIAEALQLPAMKQARLVAGEKGIHNRIKWVTIVEVLEDFTRLQEGEFLITTGYGLQENGERLASVIDKLVEQKLSGLAVHTGFYLNEIPAVWLHAADHLGFPIIEIPRQYNFSTVTKAMLEQIINRQTEMMERDNFLEELLSGQFHDGDGVTLMERGKMLGYRLNGPQTVICFRFLYSEDNIQGLEEIQQVHDRLYHTVESILQQKNMDGILRQQLHTLVLLMSSGKEGEERSAIHLAREVVNQWRPNNPGMLLAAGIGSTALSVKGIPQSAKEAEYTLLLGRLLPSDETVYHFADLEAYHLLIEMMENGVDLQSFYRRTLKELVDHSLLDTLETYLQHNLNLQNTAAALYIHRHTLKYRLQQIEKKTGKSLVSPHNRLQLQLAVMAYRLVQAMNPGEPHKNVR